MSADDVPDPRDGPLAAVRWFLRTDDEVVVLIREVASSALAVAIVGLLLFAVSGLWPPLVAVESGSMHPHLKKGDLVFVTEQHRFKPARTVGDTGVVTYRLGEKTGYSKLHEPGDVLVYAPDGNNRTTPIIHRARFWVNKNENWYAKANKSYVNGAQSCKELRNCPAPHAGFITKGDHNGYYDQTVGISSPVKPSWIKGTAAFRVPWLGWVRLLLTGSATIGGPTTHAAAGAGGASPSIGAGGIGAPA